jgi:branched-chain amino acid transport system substrate-binding protein
MKTFAWFCVALAMALVLITAPAQAAKEIKVGIVDCYSGPPATYTNDVRDAFKMEVDKINAAGGFWAARSSSPPGTASSRSISACRPPRN